MAVAPGWWFDGEGGEGGLVAVSCGHPFFCEARHPLAVDISCTSRL